MQRLIITIALSISSIISFSQPMTRLVAESYYQCDSTTPVYFTPSDSNVYFYSDSRKGVKDPIKRYQLLQFDSTKVFTTNQNSAHNWENTFNYNQAFDANNKVTFATRSNGNYTNNVYSDFKYTANGDTAIIQHFYINTSGDTTISSIDTYAYAAPGKPSYFASINHLGIMSLNKTYTYDASGNLQTYHYIHPDWDEDIEYTYTYTGSQLIQTTTKEWYRFINGFNYYSSLYHYTAGILDTAIYLQLDTTTSAHDTIGMGVYKTNLSLTPDTNTYYTYHAGKFSPQTRNYYIYDASNKNISLTRMLYDVGTSSWNNSDRILYTYSNNDVIQSRTEYWFGSWQTTPLSAINNYYYETYFTTDINGIEKPTANVTIYPIPSGAGFININVIWKEAQAFTGTIYNLQGRLISKWDEASTKEYTHSIITTNLQPGIYVLKLDGATETASRQFIVQ